MADTTEFVRVPRCTTPNSLARRAKAILDQEYSESLLIRAIAKRLRTSNGQLTRSFKDAFGMPPAKYRQWLRTMDAMMQVMESQSIAAAAQNVGYQDLGRFYKQFRQIAVGPPGKYALLRQM